MVWDVKRVAMAAKQEPAGATMKQSDLSAMYCVWCTAALHLFNINHEQTQTIAEKPLLRGDDCFVANLSTVDICTKYTSRCVMLLIYTTHTRRRVWRSMKTLRECASLSSIVVVRFGSNSYE